MHALYAALRNHPTACFQFASKLGRAGVVPCTIIDLVYFSSFIASTPCVQCKLTIGGCSELYAHSRCYFGDLAEACLSCSINPRVMLCNAGQDMHRDTLWALFAVASAVVLCFAAATPAVEHLSTIDYTRCASICRHRLSCACSGPSRWCAAAMHVLGTVNHCCADCGTASRLIRIVNMSDTLVWQY